MTFENYQMTRDEVEAATILRGVVGSTVHGLNTQDGIEDRDEMGVCVEPIEAAMGVGAPFEQFIYRTAAEREHRHDAPSRAGDLDLTIFSLRKYVRLALKGNPTVLLLLFVPEPMVLEARGSQLRDLAPHIVSRAAGGAFLGSLQAQRQRLTGERGQMRINRNDLKAKYGFDTKYAMHMLRLGFQGVELMTTGRLTLPMREPERSWLYNVRIGGVSEQECLTRAGELESEIKDLLDSSPLPKEPDSAAVERWMTRIYCRAWTANEGAGLSSELILEAVRRAWVTRRAKYGDCGVRNPEALKRGGCDAPERKRARLEAPPSTDAEVSTISGSVDASLKRKKGHE